MIPPSNIAREIDMVPTRPFWRDAAERIGATFVIAFLALYVPALLTDGATAETLIDLGVLGKAAVAGAAAALSLVKALLATRVGDGGSASLDPRV